MKIGDAVQTPQGPGKVVDIEHTGWNIRYGVELENSPFNFSPAYYFGKEIKREAQRY